MAMAHNTPPRKLWLSCGGTHTLQALILSTLVLLAASTADDDVVGTTAPSSGGGCRHYRFELTHVNANLSLSSDELMRRAYDRRSRLRAATSDSAAGGSSDSDSDSGSGSGSPARLSQGDSVYSIMFYLGNRGDKGAISAVVDTGSNLIWTTAKECLLSSTRSVVPCSSDTCAQAQQSKRSQCGSSSSCRYAVTYGGDKGTQTSGILYKDKVTFVRPLPRQSFENVAIGCSTTSTVRFQDPSIKGIVGLGRGAQSLPGQLNFNSFSYCLSSYYKPQLPSYLLLTAAPDMGAGATSGAKVATTGLRRRNSGPHKTRYFVELQGVSIDGTRLDVNASSASAGGNMFVDTGASFTELEGSVFDELVKQVDGLILADKQYSKDKSQDGRICYSSSSTTANIESRLPQMVLHLADSADMVLPWDSYLWKTSKKLCLAILKSATKGMSVLGNFQMQGIHMLFDTQNEKLSFVPADCTKV